MFIWPAMYQTKLTKWEEVPPQILKRWARACSQTPYQSPMFHPQFAELVSQTRSDVYLLTISDPSRLLAIMPVQMSKRGQVHPVGGLLNDIHGPIELTPTGEDEWVIGEQDSWNSLSFHAAQRSSWLRGYQFETLNSPQIDLREGFENYLAMASSRSRTIRRQGQKNRKLIREQGDWRFEFHNPDPQVLQRTFDAKRAKYVRTRTFDMFTVGWARDFLWKLSRAEHDDFSAVHSVLWVGDEIIASHFGLRTKKTLHYWFPIFDASFRQYSPGMNLILEICRASADRGIESVDLGYGDQRFKQKLANASCELLVGKVVNGFWSRMIAQQVYRCRNLAMRSSLRAPMKHLIRSIYPAFGHRKFR